MVTVKQFFYKVARNASVIALIMLVFLALDGFLAHGVQVVRADLVAILCSQTGIVVVATVAATGFFFSYLRQMFLYTQAAREKARLKQLRYQAFLHALEQNNRRDRGLNNLVEEIYEYLRKYQSNPKS